MPKTLIFARGSAPRRELSILTEATVRAAILAVLNEAHELRLFELLVRNSLERHTMRSAWLRVLVLELHAWLRKYVLIVLVLSSTLLFTTFLDSDAFNLALNVLVLLFIFEIAITIGVENRERFLSVWV